MGSTLKSAMTSAERTRGISRILWVTFALNLLTAALEIALGMSTRSIAVIADGVHTLSDCAANIVGLIGVRIAGHPADKNHPYGHEKFETVASMALGGFLLAVCYGILRKALSGLADPQPPSVTPFTFVVMAVTMALNVYVVWYERRGARHYHSDFLLCDSWHTMTDIFVKTGVIVALVGVKMNVPILDPLFSIVIAVIVATAAVSIMRRGLDVLTDRAVLDAAQVERLVRAVPGVADCHEIRTRGKSHAVYLDLHVLVDPGMTVEASHRLASVIERELKRGIEGIQDVVVHIEPTTHDHKELEG
jgi:cation diffusion facilitator family transporter